MRTFAYEQAVLPWALTGITDEANARHSSFGYDAQGRAISTELAGGNGRYSVRHNSEPQVVIDDSYDSASNVVVRSRYWQAPSGTQVLSPSAGTVQLGVAVVAKSPTLVSRSQPGGSGCAASTSAQSFDANSNVASADDFNGNRVCYAHDQSRNVQTVRVEALPGGAACAGLVASGAALAAGSRKVSTQWHPDWRLQTKVAEPGRITSYVYNGQPDPFANGAVAGCAPGAGVLPDGKPIAVLCRRVEQATTDTDGSLGFSAPLQADVPTREQRWTYNEFGQVLTHDGPRTDVADITVHEYYPDTAFTGSDPNALGHTRGDLRQTTSPAGHVTRYTLYDKLGQLLEMVDPNGVVTRHTYDPRQRLTSTTVAGQVTGFEYWPTGLLKRVTQPDLSWVHRDYDDAHRLIRVSDNLGNSVTYTLDNLGNRTAEDVRDPANALRRQLTRSIDALGRVQQITGRE